MSQSPPNDMNQYHKSPKAYLDSQNNNFKYPTIKDSSEFMNMDSSPNSGS